MSHPPTSRRPLSTVLVLAGVSTVALLWAILVTFNGWDYYGTPVSGRGYLPTHRVLRPSGEVGLTLGVAGMLAMLSTLPYAARKRWRPLARLGAPSRWLEVHIFFGIIGPVLVTLHTAFKFNGVVSVGYWLMMTVWASGFVGRYLYVRIPKTIRGVELSRRELEEDLARARDALSATSLEEVARPAVEDFDRSLRPARGGAPGVLDLFFGEFRVRLRLLAMRRRLRASGADLALVHNLVTLSADHAALSRRIQHLERTHRLFEWWHVFHRPLVYGMFLIVGLHVGIAIYLGYAHTLFGGAS